MTKTKTALIAVGGVAAIYGLYWLFKPVKSSADIYREADVFTKGTETGVIQLSDTERSNIMDAFNSGVDALGNPIGLSPQARDASADRMASNAASHAGGGFGVASFTSALQAGNSASTSAVTLSTLSGGAPRYSDPAPSVSERLGGRGVPGASF